MSTKKRRNRWRATAVSRLAYTLSGVNIKNYFSAETKRPKYKFEHIYETKDNAPLLARLVSEQERAQEDLTTTTNEPPKIVPNAEADLKFLSSRKWSRRA